MRGPKKSELAAFKVFEIKCYLINEDQIYRQQGIYLNKTCACICIMQMKTKTVSWDPGKDPHQILPVHLGPELQQILPLWSHHEQSEILMEGYHTLKLSTLHWVVSWLKVSYQPWCFFWLLSFFKLFWDLLWIPRLKTAFEMILQWLIYWKIRRLEEVCTIAGPNHWMLFSTKSDSIPSPLWPSKVVKMTSAICSSPSPRSLRVTEIYGRMIFLTNLMLASPLAGVCQISNPSRKAVEGWHRSVLPPYSTWERQKFATEGASYCDRNLALIPNSSNFHSWWSFLFLCPLSGLPRFFFGR